jgi:N-methylhydantoinase B/oxoprolinase/acetone carboxylase alpha subunit
MRTTKTIMLAAVAALSLGAGAAMAQESPGGVGFGPYETSQLNKIMAQQEAKAEAAKARTAELNQMLAQYESRTNSRAAAASIPVPQSGSSD